MSTIAEQQEAKLLRRLQRIKHVILVLSGKGGVGKSSVSVQLALSILNLRPSSRVGLLDVDLTGPSLPRMLGLDGTDVYMGQEGWLPVPLQNPAAASTSTENGTSTSTPGAEQSSLVCMSIGFLLKSSRDSVVWRGPKKTAMIKQFLGEVEWGDLDYLVIDTPPGPSSSDSLQRSTV